MCFEDLLSINQCANITELSLKANKKLFETSNEIIDLGNLENSVETLDFEDSDVEKKGFEAISKFNKLSKLGLNGCRRIGPIFSKIYDKSKIKEKLTYLDVTCCDIDSAGMISILNSSELENIIAPGNPKLRDLAFEVPQINRELRIKLFSIKLEGCRIS